MAVTNDQLRGSAYTLAGAMIEMLRADGLDPDITGVPDQEDVHPFGESIQIDAEMYMSMDPARLEEEYNEFMLAATEFLKADPEDYIGEMRAEIRAWWHGEAAHAFSGQLSKIETCIGVQREYTMLAVQAVGMMYAVNAQFRASCHDLMEKTALTCKAVTAKSGEPAQNWAEAGIDLVRNVIGGVANADPASVATWAIDQFLGLAGDAVKSKEVAGAEAIPVVTEYTSARDRLFAAYEDNLDQIRAWLHARHAEYNGLRETTIPGPIDAKYDVDSPDFRYENFTHQTHKGPDFAPEVSRERQRYADEKTKADGVIGHRLAGDG